MLWGVSECHATALLHHYTAVERISVSNAWAGTCLSWCALFWNNRAIVEGTVQDALSSVSVGCTYQCVIDIY